MDVTAYSDRLHRDLYAAGQVGGEEGLVLAERMAHALDPSIRLVLLDALVEAAGEITEDLAPGSVEVRLLGRKVQFAVSRPDVQVEVGPAAAPGAAPEAAPVPPAATDEPEDDGGTARLSLRLPERLKPKLEQAAAAAGLSVNAWLVRSITALVEAPAPPPRPSAPTPPPPSSFTGMGQRRSGWVR